MIDADHPRVAGRAFTFDAEVAPDVDARAAGPRSDQLGRDGVCREPLADPAGIEAGIDGEDHRSGGRVGHDRAAVSL